MNDEEREKIDKTFIDIFLSMQIITEIMINLKERVSNLEVCIVQIAKMQGGGKDIIHPN